MKTKIAIVVSHPIQHFCPQYVSFSKNENIEFKVFFGSALGSKKYLDENFKKEIHWNNLQLEKFPHVFLNGDEIIQPDKDLDAHNLESELLLYQPEILFTYGYFQKLQRRAHKWAVKNKVYLAYISDSELRHQTSSIKEFLKGFFLRRYFIKYSIFLTMGNANEEYYKAHKVPENKMLRMHYPIDYLFFREQYKLKAALRAKIRSRYNIAEKDIVLTVVGKLVTWKNQDHLIKTLSKLESDEITYHLFIIGSGGKKEAWEKDALTVKKNRVYFTGFLVPEELPAYYAATDIYAHPASLEPHSVAISEAIFMGCPVVLSDTCGSYGATDDVQENKNGYVYPFGDLEKLKEKIKLLVDNNELRKNFADYSHEIGQKFQENSHLTMIESLRKRFETERDI